MSDKNTYTVTCPCCQALLTIDRDAEVVVNSEAREQKEKTSFEERLKTLSDEKRLAEEKFKESVRAEESKKLVLEKKFQDLYKKAKEGPQGPFKRDIDLD